MPSGNARGLEYWLERLTEQELPAMSATAQEIAKLTANDDSSHVSRLADIILQDAAMTMHILRLTDSAYHLPRKRANTVSRALIMLGFNEVRSICLSIGLIGPMVRKKAHRRLVDEMARSFHASVQAMMLAVQRGDRSPEEVMIAALLRNLGEMSFWCFGEEMADDLGYEMEKPGIAAEEAQIRVLGFPLRDLTAAMGEKWGLGETLQAALKPDRANDPRVRAISLGHKLACAVEKGWDCDEVQSVIKEMAAFANVAVENLRPLVEQHAADAVQVAENYGAYGAAERIPLPTVDDSGQAPVGAANHDQAKSAETAFLQPDPVFQFKILRDILSMLERGTTVSEVTEAVLSGIYQGIGMDRAVFAVLSPNGKYVRARSALGIGQLSLIEKFKFSVETRRPCIFNHVLTEKKPLWVSDQGDTRFKPLLAEATIGAIGDRPFFLAPIVVDSQPIGVVFADRSVSNRLLDAESFESFKQFVMQAGLVLEHLGQR